MAARGNRLVGVGRFGVAILATAAVALAALEPAYAEEAAPAPTTETMNSEPTPAPAPPDETTAAPTAPDEQAPAPASEEPAAEPSSIPPAAPASGDEPAEAAPTTDAADTSGAPAEATPAETEPTPALKDVVKLEAPAPTSAPAPASAPAPTTAAPPPAATSPSGAPPNVDIVLIQGALSAPSATAPVTEAAKTEAAKIEAAIEAATIVSFRLRATPAPIALLPEAAAETEGMAPTKAPTNPAARLLLIRPQTCARPVVRVPLSDLCRQVHAVASLRPTTLAYLPNLREVRAAIARGAPPRVTIRRVEARPPPESKAAEERPLAEARPVVPFGDSGQGVTKNGFGFSSSPGSSSSSRLFALAVILLWMPWAFRFARVRLPSTLPHAVIPAPPGARPG